MTNLERALTRRIDELTDRLEELCLPNDPLRGDYDRGFYAALTPAETDYVLPEHLATVQDVLSALRRARARLDELRAALYPAREKGGAIPGQLILSGFALPLAS